MPAEAAGVAASRMRWCARRGASTGGFVREAPFLARQCGALDRWSTAAVAKSAATGFGSSSSRPAGGLGAAQAARRWHPRGDPRSGTCRTRVPRSLGRASRARNPTSSSAAAGGPAPPRHRHAKSRLGGRGQSSNPSSTPDRTPCREHNTLRARCGKIASRAVPLEPGPANRRHPINNTRARALIYDSGGRDTSDPFTGRQVTTGRRVCGLASGTGPRSCLRVGAGTPQRTRCARRLGRPSGRSERQRCRSRQ